MKITEEFRRFLEEYKVVGLAVAFVIGTAVTTFVQSLVANVIMPVINALLPTGTWQTATVSIGGIVIGWGPFLAALVNFLIIAFVVFLIVKFVEEGKKFGKKEK